MKEHWDFLKESDSSFGLFYPLHYTVLGFEYTADAKSAHDSFLSAGFATDDVAAISGAFLVQHLEAEGDPDWYDQVRIGIAKVIGTEANFLDDDVRLARRGGAFVFVYTPDQEQAEQTRTVIEKLHPVFARRYHRAGIEKVAYPSQPSTV